MQLWPREEVREDVVYARTVARVERDVVFNRDRVDLTEKSSQSRRPGGLPVQYMYICFVVQQEQRATVTEDCAIRGQGSVDGEHFTPGHLTGGGVKPLVRLGPRPGEARPYPKV
jgi:hypothetical protein